MISDKTIEAVRNLDIEDVLKSWGLAFKRRGSTMFASCPFHSEKTPSFSITPGRNLWYCHSCHRGGDGIKFYQEKEGLDFHQAVEAIAKANNLHIEYSREEISDEQRQEAQLKESVLAAVTIVHQFFQDRLRIEMDDEARAARGYAYHRWPEEFCQTRGIGLAPKDGRLLMEYCRSKAISEDLLLQSGIYRKDAKSGRIYTLFRNRLVIPIRDRFGRVIAFTARYLGDDKADNVGKYINSSNSLIFNKGASIFGIDRASRCRQALYYNIVEGAPDVLRLQSIGLENTVATLGTAWSAAQFDVLKRFTQSVCFIPDSDPPKDEPFGPGFKAVMQNGVEAVRRGFDVTVRELPFVEEKADDESVILHKNDADEYILSQEIYNSIAETPFILWLAEKKFSSASSLAEQRVIVAEVADLLRHITDDAIAEDYIASLAKINGTVKAWRSAVSRAKGEARQRAANSEPKNDAERRKELLRQCNLNIIDNCFYTYCNVSLI